MVFSLLIALTLMGMPTVIHTNPTVSQNGLTHDYNFTRLQANSFPKNISWISFQRFQSGPYSNVSVREGVNQRGLQIYGLPPSGKGNSGVRMLFSHETNFTIKLTFSWNAHASLIDTGELISLGNFAFNDSVLEFGPFYNYSLKLKGYSDSTLGSEPACSGIYTLEMAYNDAQPSKMFISVNQGWNTSSILQFPVNVVNVRDNTVLNMTVQGVYSNITLYNLFVGPFSRNTLLPSASEETLIYNSKRVDTRNLSITENLNGTFPVLDERMNSIVFIDQGKRTIDSVNYYNGTVKQIVATGNESHVILEYSQHGNVYYAFSRRETVEIINISLDSLSTEISNLTVNIDNYSRLFVLGPLYIFFDSDGNISTVHEITRSDYAARNISIPLKFVSAGISEGKFIAKGIDTLKNYMEDVIVFQNGTIEENLTDRINTTAKIVEGYISDTGGFFFASVSVGNFTNSSYVFDSSSPTVPEFLDYDIHRAWGYDMSVILDIKDNVYVVRNSTIIHTNLHLNEGSSLYFGKNLSTGLIYGYNSFTILYTGSLSRNTSITQQRINASAIHIVWDMFMGISYFSLSPTSSLKQSASITWSIDGEVVSHSNSFYIFLLPGYHTVKATIVEGNQSITMSSSIFVFGFIPELSLGLIVIFVLFRNRFLLDHDSNRIRNLILSNLGKSMREIRHIARESKVNRAALRKLIRDMVSSDEISLKEDPDGILYVMENNGSPGRRDTL